MGEKKTLSRGDRNRNQRLVRLRELVPASSAVLGIDLADRKQVAALLDHDSRVRGPAASGCVGPGSSASCWTGRSRRRGRRGSRR